MCFRNCLFLLMSMWFATSVFAQKPAAKPDSSQDNRWAFAAALIAQEINEIAVSKELSPKIMLLFGVGFQWEARDRYRVADEVDVAKSYRLKTKRYFVELRPEWRRYVREKAHWSMYFGLQPHFGYSWEQNEGTIEYKDPPPPGGPVQSFDPGKETALSIGLAATLGVEYMLLRNLSVSIHFRPLNYTYSYEKSPGNLYGAVSETIKEHSVTFAQNTAIFLRIYF